MRLLIYKTDLYDISKKTNFNLKRFLEHFLVFFFLLYFDKVRTKVFKISLKCIIDSLDEVEIWSIKAIQQSKLKLANTFFQMSYLCIQKRKKIPYSLLKTQLLASCSN